MGRCKRFVAVLLVLTMILSFSSFVFGAETDIDNHWAEEEIKYMMGKGIVSGYPDGNFKPDKQITRAEFVKIINYIFGYSEKDSISFIDVKEGDWFYEEIEKAVRAGYISGYTDGTMQPNNPITRQEVSKVMGIVFGLDESRKSADDFTDVNQIGDWAKGYVGILKDKGYISGYPDGAFRPGNPITRAESVKIVTNASGIIINEKGEYSEDAAGNVLVNTSDVTLKGMKISGDLYLVEGIGDGNVALDNVAVEGKTHIRGGGKDSITIRNSKIGQIFAKKAEGDVRLVLEGKTEIPSMVLDGNGILVIKKGTKVDSIEIIGKWIIEIEEGARVGLIEVKAEGVEIKSEGSVDLIRPTEKIKINDELIEKGKEVKIEDGEIKYIEEEKEPEDSKPSGSGPSGPSKPDPGDEVKAVGVTGEAVIGKTLVASLTPSGATVNYQWMRSSAADGEYTDISGATSKTYELDDADENKWIKVKATGTGNYEGTVTSDPLGPIKAGAVEPISYASTAAKNFDVSVDCGTGENAAIAKLVEKGTVDVTGTEGETGTATISWTIASYDGDSAGTYTATGVLTLPSGWTGTAADVTAIVTVKEKIVTPPTYASTEDKNFDISVAYGTGESTAIDRLERTVGVTGTEGETGTATIVWTISGYNGSSADDYTATGVLTLPTGWTGTAANVTATVTVEAEAVAPPAPVYSSTGALRNSVIEVDYGTSKEDAEEDLDDSITVVCTRGNSAKATISWTIEECYECDVPGDYTATGVLTLPGDWEGTADDVIATVTVKEPKGVVLIAQGNFDAITSTVRVEGYTNFAIYFDEDYIASSRDDGTVIIATAVLRTGRDMIKVETKDDGVMRSVERIIIQ